MPVWLQVFYIFLAVIMLGWATWITLLVIAHGNKLSKFEERCDNRCKNLTEISQTVWRTSRNIVRIGMKMGIEDQLERESP